MTPVDRGIYGGIDGAIDGALAVAVPFLTWRTLVAGDLPRAVVLFIALGLLSAVAWGRLGAPDVALVEAAVGAGVTGALLMSALGWVRPARGRRLSWYHRAALAAALAALAAGLARAVLGLPDRSAGLRDEVLARLGETGVAHPVTAVLLNFRGYDTLLEIVVLLAAAIGAAGRDRPGPPRDDGDPTHPLLPVLVRLLIPGSILVAGYLLWRGSRAPGGAFQAGAILAGAGILLLLAGTVRPPARPSAWVRVGLAAGPAVFLAVAAAPLARGRHLLEYPPGWAGGLILAVESALTLSIALILAAFFRAVARLEPSGATRPGERGR